jgi:hypothetical protein
MNKDFSLDFTGVKSVGNFQELVDITTSIIHLGLVQLSIFFHS